MNIQHSCVCIWESEWMIISLGTWLIFDIWFPIVIAIMCRFPIIQPIKCSELWLDKIHQLSNTLTSTTTYKSLDITLHQLLNQLINPSQLANNTVDGRYPVPPWMVFQPYNGVNYLPTGAGFLPSTVWLYYLTDGIYIYIYTYIYIFPINSINPIC